MVQIEWGDVEKKAALTVLRGLSLTRREQSIPQSWSAPRGLFHGGARLWQLARRGRRAVCAAANEPSGQSTHRTRDAQEAPAALEAEVGVRGKQRAKRAAATGGKGEGERNSGGTRKLGPGVTGVTCSMRVVTADSDSTERGAPSPPVFPRPLANLKRHLRERHGEYWLVLSAEA